MPWFKVDDKLAFHHKTMLAGTPAMGLWVRAGAWSASVLTDGFIPTHMVTAMSDGDTTLVSRLVDAGLWHESPGGYLFHEWEEVQPSASAIRQSRVDEAERKARWRASKKGSAGDNSTSAQSRGDTEGTSGGTLWDEDGTSPDPDPTRPDPTSPSSGRTSSGKRAKPELPLPDDWEPTDSHRKMAGEAGLDLAYEARQFRLHAETKGRRAKSWNAAFSMWLNKAGHDYRPTQQQRRPVHLVSEAFQ